MISFTRFSFGMEAFSPPIETRLCDERALSLVELTVEGPILLRDEALYFCFPLADEPKRDRLYPAGGEPVLHLLPQKGREVVTNQPVEDPPRLLGIHLRDVQSPGMIDRLADCIGGDLVENNPLYGQIRVFL
jgi:hypothetical protein